MPRQCKVERLPAEKCAAEDSKQFQKAVFSPRFILRAPVAFSPADDFNASKSEIFGSASALWNIMEFGRIADLSKLSSKTAGMTTGARGSGGRTSNCCRALPQCWPCTAPWAAIVVVFDWSAGLRRWLRFLPPVTSFRVKQLRPSTPQQCRDKDAGEPWTPETCCPDSEDESTSEAGSEGFGCGWDLPVTTVVLPMQPGPLFSPAYCPSS